VNDDDVIDVAVVGAGFAGMYLLHRLRSQGLRVRVFEAADDVGGTWYWNRYPGARCDVQSVDYSYSFDPTLDDEWRWSEKYATQPEILRYAQHVADRFDLRRDIAFSTRLDHATWDDSARRWTLTLSPAHSDDGHAFTVSARFYVMATGCLSVPKDIDVAGAERFAGPTYLTGRWPHEGVDFTGMRVGVIGTGSSAIQSIPLIAKQASELTVFQRTANFSIPAYNGATPAEKWAAVSGDRAGYRHAARYSGSGVPMPIPDTSALAVSDDDRLARYEQAWADGGIIEFLGTYMDHLASPVANEHLAEFVRSKIRGIVADPVTAEALCPTSFPIGTKRLCVDSGYYETFNQPHVRLVDLRSSPITTITETGIELAHGASTSTLEFDAIVFATGFDAMTGALVSVDITGRGGRTLKEQWAHGPTTYLGLMAEDFPNMFMITGPGSPSVLSNMIVSIEQHVDWISDCLATLGADGHDLIEPTATAVDGWVQHVNDFASITLMPQANSWYMGANVPGKPRVFLPYVGGCERYRVACDEVVARDYLGFRRSGPAGDVVVDGVVRKVQPDVQIMLDMMAQMGMPSLETLPVDMVRMMMEASYSMRLPGPEVGAMIDGTLPSAEGSELAYRLYRPASPGPHQAMVYFHGGGWVIGSHLSDEPFCRALCDATNLAVISVNYRHAPEATFPAAADDAYAALLWVDVHRDLLGVSAAPLLVGGWSAGGTLAAVVAEQARADGGPAIAAQMLLTPATDGSREWPSMESNADGYGLTRNVMRWFWGHYTTPEQRLSPTASPLLAPSHAGLPPTIVITCDFDPLRDEGNAYADALRACGVDVTQIRGRGQTHTSLLSVDMLPSTAPVRAEIFAALRAVSSA
jgi:cation diffusion facilitator CzcD-associated flavoprotein CzcO/acetyl esterase/lipase